MLCLTAVKGTRVKEIKGKRELKGSRVDASSFLSWPSHLESWASPFLGLEGHIDAHF